MALARSRSYTPGHALHVIQRGRLRAACFFTEDDRLAYLQLLARQAPRSRCALHAYVLMGNHVHLLLTPARPLGVAALMASLAARYAHRLGREGDQLFEDGFEAAPVHARQYVLACMRYIELNPVRARLVHRPGAYRWSSFGANALGDEDPLVTPHASYCALGRSAEARRAAYRASFGRPGVGQDPADDPGRASAIDPAR